MRLFRAMIAMSVCLLIASTTLPCRAQNESVEPPLKYSLQVGDKTITISEGDPVQLNGSFTNPKIKLTPQDHREFAYQGIRFKYPRSFVFEADLADQSSRSWTLTGNDVTLMYFVLAGEITTVDFANNMISQFGQENARITQPNMNTQLGQQNLQGTTLRVKIASHQLQMDIYRVPSRSGETKLLVFQDSLGESGSTSAEAHKTLAQIKSSFELRSK